MADPMLPESVRAHPYAWSSVACHLVLLGCLLAVDRVRGGDAVAAPSAPTPAMLRARDEKLQRQIQSMERVKRLLDETKATGQSGDKRNDPPDPAERLDGTPVEPEHKARALAADIERSLQEDRARELARILKIPEQAAREQLKRERTSSKPLSIDELTRRADEALVFRQRERDRQRNGIKLGTDGGARHASYGQVGQAGAGGHSTRATLGMGHDPDSTHTVVERRNYEAETGTPKVDANRMRAGAGRIFGAGAPFANRVYLDSWYMIGPFAGVGQESIDNGYPPESIVDLDAVYAGMGGRALRWRYEQFGRYPLVPAGYTEAAVYYGYTEIDMDRERDVVLAMGADDDAKLWVNDELVWQSGKQLKPWYRMHFKYLTGRIATLNLNETTRTVRLRKGRNSLLFKLYNGSGATFVSVVMTPR